MNDTQIKYGVVVHNFPIEGKDCWCANVGDDNGKVYVFDINEAYRKREEFEKVLKQKYTVEEFDEKYMNYVNGYRYVVKPEEQIIYNNNWIEDKTFVFIEGRGFYQVNKNV